MTIYFSIYIPESFTEYLYADNHQRMGHSFYYSYARGRNIVFIWRRKGWHWNIVNVSIREFYSFDIPFIRVKTWL